MTKGIDRFVSENREATKRIDSTFVEVSSNRKKRFDFGTNVFQIPTSIEVYTRPLNDGLYSGHPNAQHGSGRGTAGDRRGSWTLQTEEEVSEEFLKEGRNAVRDALAGDANGTVGKTVVGNGTNDALASNTQLQNKTGENFSWGYQGPYTNSTIARSHYLFGQFGDAVSEFGVESRGGQLYNRITTSSINPNKSEEMRVDILFEVGGYGRGNSAITDDGRDAVAETIRSSDSLIGIEEYAFGDGDSNPTNDDIALDNELFTKTAQNEIEPEIVSPHTVVFEPEPSTQPHTIREMGIKDNNGRLLWRTVIDDYDKDSSVEFEVYAGFRAK